MPDGKEADLATSLESGTDSVAATLVAEIRESLNGLPERDREILARRVGFDSPPATLAEIGAGYRTIRMHRLPLVAPHGLEPALPLQYRPPQTGHLGLGEKRTLKLGLPGGRGCFPSG